MKKLVGTIHLWIGLSLCLPLVLLGLTGSWLTYDENVRALFDPPPARILAQGAAKSAAEILAAARAAVPSGFVASLYAPPGEDGLASVRFTRSSPGGGRLTMRVDPVSLATTEDAPRSTWMHNLHASLWLQDVAGRSVAGWFGVAMLALGLSGIVNWWPRKPIRFDLRLRGYLANHDIHGAVGIWGLVVFLLVSFSGVALCFPRTIRAAVEIVTPVRDMRGVAAAVKVAPVPGAQPMSLDEAIALARGADAQARVGAVSLPQRPTQPLRVRLLSPGQELGMPILTVFVDPWTRRIVERLDPREFSAAEAALAWQHGLHQARGLGPVWKALVFLSGFLPLVFTITGLRMWWLKRRAASSRPTADYAIENELR